MNFFKSTGSISPRSSVPTYIVAMLPLLFLSGVGLAGEETNVVTDVAVPLNPDSLNPVPLTIKHVIVWLGPALFFFFLGVFNLIQTFRSRSGLETVAKVLVNCLGFVLVFWIWSTFKIEHTRSIEAFLKSPAPLTGSAQIWCGVLSATLMIGFLFALEALGDLTAGKNALQALTIFVSCVAIYLLAPLMAMLSHVDQLVSTRFYHIAIGAVIGGTLYLIFLLFYLGTRKAKSKS